jgi:lipoic acid synthetase
VLHYWEPAAFDALAEYGMQLGFEHVASGPLVRSSYHADQMAHASGLVDVA